MLAKLVRERDLAISGLVREDGNERALGEVVDAYLSDLASMRRPRYVRRVQEQLGRLRAAFGSIQVRDVTPTLIIERRRKRIAQGASFRTANIEVGSLRSGLNWAVRTGLIVANPIAGIRPLPVDESTVRTKRRALTEEETGRFLRAAEDEDREREASMLAERTIAGGSKGLAYAMRPRTAPVPQAPLFRAILWTGLRWGEAASLVWADVDIERRSLTVQAGTAKNHRSRQVPLSQQLAEDLADLRAFHTRRDGPRLSTDRVFLTPLGRAHDPDDSSNTLKLLRRVLDHAGIAHTDENGRVLDLHALRGSAATRMFRHGLDVAIVSRVLGHQDPRLTLKHYTDLRLSDSLAAIDKVASLVAAPNPTADANEVGSILAIGGGGSRRARPPRSTKLCARHDLAADGPCRTRTGNQQIMSPQL